LNKLPKVLHDPTKGIAPESSSCCSIGRQWSTEGAQEFPFGVVVVDRAIIDDVLFESSVFYAGGPPENRFVGFMTR